MPSRLALEFTLFTVLSILPSAALARTDMGDGWFGGTGILCQKKWAFDRDLKAGQLKIVGHGYKHQDLPPEQRGTGQKFSKTVVIVATTKTEADYTLTLLIISVIQTPEGPAFC